MKLLKKIFFNKLSIIILVIAFSLYIWYFVLWLNDYRETIWNYLPNTLYATIPMMGGFIAMGRFKQWGGVKSTLGKVLFFIGLGLLTWSIGMWIWTYYNLFLVVEIPYPSYSDFFYLLAYPLLGIGIILFG